jgi:ribonucleoside-triphosphate reductase (thioredoxin)
MKGKKLLSDIAFFRTYSAITEDGTKETWEEVCNRYENMLLEKYPHMWTAIHGAVEHVRAKRVLPSMRALQFAGSPILRENARLYNCSFLNITTFKDFADSMYLSACGTGVGYSVQRRHIEQLPVIDAGSVAKFVIADNRERWADSLLFLLNNPQLQFDYSNIRPAGTKLSTGGTASGYKHLETCHEKTRKVLMEAIGRQLRPIEVHKIMTYIADAIVAGGVRRSAMICLFDRHDEEMLNAKTGEWWMENPSFARANNSAVLPRGETTREEFDSIMDACYRSQAGEPGVFWTNDLDWGTNPCAEIALRSRQFCNLTEINVAAAEDRYVLRSMVWAATVLGTFQAGFTDFGYIHPDWSKNAQEDALLGVGMTGQAQRPELMTAELLSDLAGYAKSVNTTIADLIGINRAKRIGTVKPSGTTSTVLGTTSGIHAAHAPYYFRRIRVDKTDPVAKYLRTVLPQDAIEHSLWEPQNDIIKLPVNMEGITRHDETAIELGNRALTVRNSWIAGSHREGQNLHNVSLTINYKKEEEQELKTWMWQNRALYGGISLLPFSDATYDYAPFEECSEKQFHDLEAVLPVVDLSMVQYEEKDDGRSASAACEGGLCEIKLGV